MTGLQPREFTWVIAGRLAVAERVGGSGFQHRRVRREEEIAWLRAAGINTVLSLLPGNQNLAAYAAGGLKAVHEPLLELEPAAVERVLAVLRALLRDRGVVLLLHRDTIDDAVAGILAGYLVYSGLVGDPIQATALIQEILRRPLGPEARAVIPPVPGA
ncbi:MAG: hypothetical protein FJW79_09635 [Actinobacteria bacterium]|nr:hypothetical protein [Actinomycetota bacterium]